MPEQTPAELMREALAQHRGQPMMVQVQVRPKSRLDRLSDAEDARDVYELQQRSEAQAMRRER